MQGGRVSGDVHCRACRSYVMPREAVFGGYRDREPRRSNDMCDYDVTGEWYTMRSGLDAGGNRVLFTIEAEPNATGEERGFTVHLRYFTNEDSFTVRQESE